MALEAGEVFEEVLDVVGRKILSNLATSGTDRAAWGEAKKYKTTGDLFKRIVLKVPVGEVRVRVDAAGRVYAREETVWIGLWLDRHMGVRHVRIIGAHESVVTGRWEHL